MPSLTIIGGPNGSGKTTLTKYLIDRGRVKPPVINADEIAYNELGGYQFHVGVARLALSRRKEAIDKHYDVAFETTFSGKSEINEAKLAKAKGYKLILYFVALQSSLDNLIRVQQREANAWHSVGQEDILRRYKSSKLNLNRHLSLFDIVYLFDNSGEYR